VSVACPISSDVLINAKRSEESLNHQRSPDLDMGFRNRPLAWVPVHVNELDLLPLLKESLREKTGNYARGGFLHT